MDNTIQALTLITQGLLTANVAVPIVFNTISAIAAIIRTAAGEGPSLVQLADLIDAQVAANDEAGQAEVARLREQLG